MQDLLAALLWLCKSTENAKIQREEDNKIQSVWEGPWFNPEAKDLKESKKHILANFLQFLLQKLDRCWATLSFLSYEYVNILRGKKIEIPNTYM